MHPSQNVLQCPSSAVVLFPEEIYKSVGSSVVLPQLLQAVPVEKLCAVQFLRNGAVRLTFKQTADCDDLVLRGVMYGDTPLRVVSADKKSRLVYLRDCPSEVSDDAVSQFFSTYGEVLSVQRSKHAAFPVLLDGNRVVRMSLSRDIPSTVNVAGFDCRVWYARQPPQCSICSKSGHRNRDCPLSGLCRRCRQPGHLAKECKQAWGSTRSADSSLEVPLDERTEVLVSGSVDPIDESPDFVPSADEASFDECEMASGDEEVVAQAEPSPPPRRPSITASSCSSVGVSPSVDVPDAGVTSDVAPGDIPDPSIADFSAAAVVTSESVVAEPPVVPVPKPSPSIFVRLKAAAVKDILLRKTLERYGHVITEKLLMRIPQDVPFASGQYLVHLTHLADERLAYLGRIEKNVKANSTKR